MTTPFIGCDAAVGRLPTVGFHSALALRPDFLGTSAHFMISSVALGAVMIGLMEKTSCARLQLGVRDVAFPGTLNSSALADRTGGQLLGSIQRW